MNQILTDAEITLIIRECARGSAINRDGSTSHRIARAIEQAILNKLNSAEPVGEVLWFDPSLQESPEKAGLIVDGYMSFMDKAKIGDRLYLHPPAPRAVEGWTAIHLKTGNEYQVIGEAIDATNTHCNQLMVIYQRDGKTFVREAEEFQEKFKAAAPSAVEGWTLVPTEILDAFPEINPSNYDHDDACRLNAWGVELVLAAARSEE